MPCFPAGQVQLAFSTSSKLCLGIRPFFIIDDFLHKGHFPSCDCLAPPAFIELFQIVTMTWLGKLKAMLRALRFWDRRIWLASDRDLIFHLTLRFLVTEVFGFGCEIICLKFFYDPIISSDIFQRVVYAPCPQRGANSLSFRRLAFSWSCIPLRPLVKTRLLHGEHSKAVPWDPIFIHVQLSFPHFHKGSRPFAEIKLFWQPY